MDKLIKMEKEKENLRELDSSELLEINGGEPCSAAIIGVGILIGIAISLWKNRKGQQD